MTSKRLLSWLGVFAATLVLAAGCAKEEEKPSAPPAEIVSFLASPAAIDAGQTTRLSWQTNLASRVQVIEVGGAEIDLGTAPVASGSVEVTPGATTTYALRAFNEDDKAVEKTVEVQVTPLPAAPVIDSFTATPAEVGLGDDVTFAWTTQNADSVMLVDAAGRAVNLQGAAAAQGQVVIQARSSTTYTLTAKGIGGEITANAAVKVNGSPRVTLVAPAEPVLPGDEATVAWTSENAASIRVSDENGNILFQGSDRANGSVIVHPDFSTRYVVEATGGTGSGDASASAVVQVRPVVDSFAVTTEGPIHSGDEVDLAWRIRGARSLHVGRLGATGLDVQLEQIAEGTTRMIVGADGVFKLAARSGALLTEAIAAVPVSLAPKVRGVEINPPVVSASVDYPANVTVSWMIDGAARAELEAIPGGNIPINGYSPRADSVMVSITETTTFRVHGFNESGEGIGEATVVAWLAPTVHSFQVLPSTAEVGETVHLSWETSDAERIVIEKDGIPLAVQQDLLDGTFTDQVFVDSTYVLRTWNPANFEVDSQPVSIRVGTPAVVSFAGDVALGHVGQPLTFNWQNDGGQSLAITDETGATVCTSTDLVEIAAGSCTITAPATTGHHVYTLHLTSGLGNEVTATYELDLTDGPIVRSLTADRTILTTGETIVVSWSVEDDATGNDPVLVLTDDIGNTYDLGTAGANAGSATITPLGSGLRTLTLGASAGSTIGHTATLGLDIRNVPAITLFAADPEVVDTAGGTIAASSNLHWTSTDGYSLALYALDANGNRMMPALLTSSVPAEALNGTFTASPIPGTNEFELEVNNGAGTVDTAVVTVYVDPAEILTFNAAPTEILAGEPVTLSWTTNRATEVKLSPAGGVYTSIANSPTKRLLDNSTTYDALVALNFPAGFTFPFDGANRTSIMVSSNGFLSFGSPSASNYNNTTIPSPSNSTIHLMPFWDELARNSGGSMTWDNGVDAEGQYVVIQWNDYRGFLSSGSSLNYQVVLYANGAFEYRYGSMSGDSTSTRARANGNSATIGFQNTTGTVGTQISYNTEYPGGLSNRTFRFNAPSLQPNEPGLVKSPRVTTTYTLTASNAHSLDTATQQVIVHQPVSVTANAPTTDLTVGTAFPISWTTTNAIAVEVLDGSGQVLYTAAANELASGTYSRTETTEGQYTYTVRAHGSLGRDIQVATVSRPVYAAPLTLTSFTASPSVVGPGNPVALTWAGSGAASVEITANGTPLGVTGKNPNADTLSDLPAVNTTYVLTLRDAPTNGIAQRSRSLTRSVVVSSTRISATPTTQGTAGSVPVSWTSTDADYVTVRGVANVSDVSATSSFIDVSTSGTMLIGTSGGDAPEATIDLTSTGFAFPFDGQMFNQLRIAGDGFLTFDVTTDSTGGNVALPSNAASSSTSSKVNMAVFWDDLDTKTTGQIWWKLETPATGPRYVVVQWKNFQFWSSSANPSDMNFEIVLFEDGTWEYRYGAFSGASTRATGNDATIGWQAYNASGFGATWSHNTAVSGGLANKSIRFNPHLPASGSINVNAGSSGTIRVCAVSAAYTPCQDVQAVVVKAGDVMIGEIMMAPAAPVADPDGEWIEIRNTAPIAIDINGWVIGSSTGEPTATINNGGPLLIQPGQSMVLAHSGASSNGGIAAGYVYGNGPSFDHTAADEVNLTYGTVQIDRVAWTTSWTMTAGSSLSLDPSYYIRDATQNDASSKWCTSATSYDGGTNRGSPGTVGTGCRYPRYDLDPLSSKPFIDISATGTQLPTAVLSDDATVQLPGGINFLAGNFPFFGGNYNDVWVCSNGWISFMSTTSTAYSNTSMPNSGAPNFMVAPFWDDLINKSGSSLKFEKRTVGANEVMVIQWTNWETTSYSGTLTFQIQLWDNGDIVTAYRDAAPADPTSSSAVTNYAGSSATIGLEDSGVSGSQYVQFSSSSSTVGGQSTVYPGRSLYFKRK